MFAANVCLHAWKYEQRFVFWKSSISHVLLAAALRGTEKSRGMAIIQSGRDTFAQQSKKWLREKESSLLHGCYYLLMFLEWDQKQRQTDMAQIVLGR